MPKLLLTLSILLLLSACGPNQPVVDQHTIEQARTVAQMESLLARMQSDLRQNRENGRNSENLQQNIQVLQTKLARQLAAEYRKQAESERVQGRIPINRLDEGLQLLERLKQLSPQQAASFSKWLRDERQQSELAQAALKTTLEQTDVLHLNQRMQILQQLEALTGKRQALLQEELETQYTQAVSQQAQQYMQEYRYPAARELLDAAIAALPQQNELQLLKKQAEAEILANEFEQALEDGKPDQALQTLRVLQQEGAIEQVQQRLAAQISALARFYADRGVNALKSENWPRMWQDFNTAREILALGKLDQGLLDPSVDQLHKALQKLSVRARQEGLPGLQLTYLLMLQQWLDSPQELDAKLQRPKQETLNQAIHRLSISPFKASEQHQGLGAALAASLTTRLLKQIPHDVRIVERDELEAIIRERALSTRRDQRGMKIAPADFLIQGNLLDASVEHAEKQSYQTERVQTGVRTVPNPEHQRWEESRKRNKLPEPPATLQQPVYEDVRYSVTLHKNTAVLSASYRLIDATTAKIIKSSTITREKTLSDISSEGVQLGSYNKPLKLADLPSDAEMLKDLLEEVAAAMSDELVATLSHTEEEHLHKAEQQAQRGNYAEAAELAARAWVIGNAKGQPVEEIYTRMVQYALQAGI